MVLLTMVISGELLPGTSAPMVALGKVGIGDLVIHFVAYAVLALIPSLGLSFNLALMCLGITQVTGIALEVAQSYVPGRSYDLYDIVANTAGLVSAGVAAGMFRYRCAHQAVRRESDHRDNK